MLLNFSQIVNVLNHQVQGQTFDILLFSQCLQLDHCNAHAPNILTILLAIAAVLQLIETLVFIFNYIYLTWTV